MDEQRTCYGFAVNFLLIYCCLYFSVLKFNITIFVYLGLGFGLGYCSGSSQIGIYFDKRRSLAFGIASMGAPASSIVMPPLLVYLTDVYGWRGAVLIVAGIFLHLAVGGALLRPVSVTNELTTCASTKTKNTIEISLNDMKHKRSDANLASSEKDICLIKDNVRKAKSQIFDMRFPLVDITNYIVALSGSAQCIHSKKEAEENMSLSLPALSRSNKTSQTKRNSIELSENDVLDGIFSDHATVGLGDQNSKLNTKTKSSKNISSHFVTSLIISPAIADIDFASTQGTFESKLNFLKAHVKPYFSLMKQWRFMIFCIVGVLDFAVRLTPASFIVVHAKTQGISKDYGALLLVIFAVFDCGIRPLSGNIFHHY